MTVLHSLLFGANLSAGVMDRGRRRTGFRGRVPARHKPYIGVLPSRSSLLNEALRLTRDGVAPAADIVRAVSDGLGCRCAFMRSLQKINLNAPGRTGNYTNRYWQR